MIERGKKLPGKYYRKHEYEFPYHIKHQALIENGSRCFVTKEYGTPEDPIEIHHMLAVWAWYCYFRNDVPVSVLTSKHNAIPLLQSVHEELHREATLEHFTQMATLLMVMAREDKQQLAMF
jgi:hypothetical protein